MRGFDAHPAAPWDWAWITSNPEVMPGTNFQRRGPEVTFEEIALDFPQARFWLITDRDGSKTQSRLLGLI